MRPVFPAAILAGPLVAQKDVKSGEGRPRLGLHVFFQRDDARHFHLEAGGMDDLIVFGDDAHTVKEHSLDGFLP